MSFRDDIRVGSNVRLQLREKPGGRVVDKRESHNIFVNYGREWISELTAYDSSLVPFRNDRVRYVGVGIGGTTQGIPSAQIRTAGYAGFADDWDYVGSDLSTGGTGGTGTADPTQTDQDPTVTGLEYPVQITDQNYYDEVKLPSSFPEAGVARFTVVLGYSDVSFSSFTSVPISEVGLFVGSVTEGVQNVDYPPLDATESRDPTGAGPPYYPPVGTRFMIAYNTFDTLTKTNAFVLQIDWELRFS